ncbi:MAG: 1-deoxy-D-xylulose-5-phosphate reductoisomerase, partial [Lachnospiraceae bacterium]|nr:1-deoxy-D-xylulose-5-phosphate reductoisomerase [Lachnospiraceae bacterium]
MKHISIIGSTGSIGTQTLDIVRANDDIKVVALAAGSNVKLLCEQAREFKPDIIGIWDEDKAKELRIALSEFDIRIVSGMDGLIEVAAYVKTDIVVTAIVGMIGIRPTVEAIKAGK